MKLKSLNLELLLSTAKPVAEILALFLTSSSCFYILTPCIKFCVIIKH
ncbi:MAG TPA: hypothetical protein K8V51_03950 [Campylobacter avium]|nr:hypothetical protein [Campylobacter avium]HJE66200.1 hypothetical protein [Campylobacter avium]